MTTVSCEHFGFVTDCHTSFLPAARSMSHGVTDKVCARCGSRDEQQLKLCSMCRMTWYCNEDHQRQHWSQHKIFCLSKKRGGKNGTSGKNKNGKKVKKQTQKTNFSFDKTVLEGIEGSQAAAISHDEMQFQGGGQGLGRSAEPDLSTPIDSSHSLEASSQAHNKTPPLYHVQDHVDTHTLEKAGLNSEWFASVLHSVISDLNEYGFCVVDGLLGAERAEQILGEVKALHSMGVFQAGQVVSQHVQAQARGMIRGDDITWVTGTEPQCSSIGQLVSVVDALVARANRHRDAGKLAEYNITWRTRAMVACYPGRDTHYVKHVDNPNGDGRCITAIYYLNKDWTAEDGGILRILPENYRDQIVAIEPCFDRMLFFWSDRRNPHEVLPAKITRYAITVWYLDQKEREDYLARGDRAHT